MESQALIQHFLNFFPDPQGQGSFRPMDLIGDKTSRENGFKRLP
jgi:hypothetical protein